MAYIGAEPVPGQNREVDDISSGFNGNATAFTLQVNSVNVSPESAKNILVNLGGVLQNPDTDYTINASTLTFTTAPASGLSFFGLILGAGINTATVADGAITTAKLASDAVGANQLANTAVTAGSYTTADITVDAQGRITAAASGTISGAEIADQAVTNAKVNNSAAIAGTKISPDFGSQAITTTSDSVTIGDSIIHSGDTNTKIRFPAADTFSVETAGSERLRIDSTGRVGINATSFNDAAEYLLVKNDSTAANVSIVASNDAHSSLNLGDEDDFNIQKIRSDHTDNSLAFFTNNVEALRIDSSGRILINKTTNRDKYFNGTYTGKLQVEGTDDSTRLTQLVHNSNSASQHIFVIGKSRGGVGSYTSVADNDFLGTISFQGADGDEMVDGARIEAQVNGTPSNDAMPTDLLFKTNTGGASPTERIRITENGTVQIAASGAIAGFSSSSVTNNIAPLKIYKNSSVTHSAIQLIWDHFNTTASISQRIQFTVGDDASSDGFNNAGFIGIEKIDSWQSSAGRNSALIFGTTSAATEAEGMRLDNAGRLIIGRTSTAASDTNFKLQVFSASGGAMGVGSTNTDASGTATINLMPSNSVTGSQIVCIAEEDFSTSNNRTARLEFKTRQDGTLTTVMSLASNSAFGAIGIYNQTTSSGANVNVASDGHVRRSTSSRKYKNTITDATHGLTELLKLKSVTFKGNDDGDTVFGGLIAEDVHDAGLTEFVQYDKDNQPDALAYGNMVALCVKAIQELTARVAALEAA